MTCSRTVVAALVLVTAVTLPWDAAKAQRPIARAPQTQPSSAQLGRLRAYAVFPAGIMEARLADLERLGISVEDIIRAIERLEDAEKAQRPAIHGISNRVVRDAIAGALSGLLALLEVQQASFVYGDHPSLVPALEALVTGKAITYLSTGEPPAGWGPETLRAYAEFMEVFAHRDAVRTKDITAAFVRAVERQWSRQRVREDDGQVEDFLRRLADCAR